MRVRVKTPSMEDLATTPSLEDRGKTLSMEGMAAMPSMRKTVKRTRSTAVLVGIRWSILTRPSISDRLTASTS